MKTVLNFDTKFWAFNRIRDSKTFQKKYLLEENQQIIININVKNSTFGGFFVTISLYTIVLGLLQVQSQKIIIGLLKNLFVEADLMK